MLEGPFGRLVADWVRAWERWDAEPHSRSRSGRLVETGGKVAACIPEETSVSLDRAVIRERRATRLPASFCIKKVVRAAIAGND